MKSFNPKASTVPGSCDFLFCMRHTVETIKNILGNTINPPLSLCVGTSCETHMGTDYRVLPSKTAHLYTVVISFVLKIFRNKRRRPQKSFCVHCILIWPFAPTGCTEVIFTYTLYQFDPGVISVCVPPYSYHRTVTTVHLWQQRVHFLYCIFSHANEAVKYVKCWKWRCVGRAEREGGEGVD